MNSYCCDICDNGGFEILSSQKTLYPLWWKSGEKYEMLLQYVCCEKCGFVTLFPLMESDEYKRYYELSPTPSKESFDLRSSIFVDRRNFLDESLTLSDIESIVEIGPAYGNFLMLFDDIKIRAGIEPSQKYREYVKKENLPLTYYPYVLEDISSNVSHLLNSFSLVVASHVLEHVPSPKLFIEKMISLTKEDGYIYIEVPSLEGMSECEEPLFQNLFFGHLSQFSEYSLIQLGISLSLDLVSKKVENKGNYPVIRVLFQKVNRVKRNKCLFQNHLNHINSNMKSAVIKFKKIIKENDNIVIWGCGDDLYTVFAQVEQDNEIARKIKLVDLNKKKQGKVFYNKMKINSPNECMDDSVDVVIIPSRGKILQENIRHSVQTLNGECKIECLF